MSLKYSTNAMLLAAGFGTRLRAITKDLPKPLAQLNENTTIIDTVVKNFLNNKINNITVNLHYEKDKIKKHLKNKFPAVNFNFVEEKEILGTGGGIKNAKKLLQLSDYTIISNSDILYRFDFEECLKNHIKSKALVSLLVFENQDERGVKFNSLNQLTGFSGKNGEPLYNLDKFIKKHDKTGTFTGIHILSKEFFNLKELNNKQGFFSIIDVYVDMLKNYYKINIIRTDKYYWNDVGTPDSFEKGKRDFAPFYHIENNLNKKITSLEKLFQGASDKLVLKANIKNSNPLIVITSESKEELKATNCFSKFLKNYNFPTPQVIEIDKDNKWIIETNAGEYSLLDITKKSQTIPVKLYKKSIDAIKILSTIPVTKFPENCCYQTSIFNIDNIIFDLNYFNNYYLNNKLTDKEVKTIATSIFNTLTTEKLCPMHRDFQSTNILINKNYEISIVDIQTMRIGFAVYDLVSLLFDSYIPFDENIIIEMLHYYYKTTYLTKNQQTVIYSTALIRLLQNAAAFSKLKDKPFFKNKLTPCKERIKWILTQKQHFLPKEIIKILPPTLF